MNITDLMEKAKTRANLPSDYALAKAMGVERQVVSGWKKGKRHPSNDEAIQLATLAGLNEMEVIAWIELETAKNPKKKEFWRHYIESRGLTACVVMTALACSIILTPEKAEASGLQLQNYDAHFHVQSTRGIYIMRIYDEAYYFWNNQNQGSLVNQNKKSLHSTLQKKPILTA